MIDRLGNWLAAERSALGLALFRFVTALMATRHLAGYVRDVAREGPYTDVFHLPYFAWTPTPSPLAYQALLAAGLLSAVALAVGWRTRAAAVATFLCVGTHFALNEVWYRHNRYFLLLALFLLMFAPCDRALSLDAVRTAAPPVGPWWTRFLIQSQMTLIYLASASSKLLDPAWRSGKVLEGRGVGLDWGAVMPSWVLAVIPPAAGARLLTSKALFMEYFLATGLWFPRTRRLAIWAGVLFHGFIEVRYSVLTFSYLTIATYFLFADLRPGARLLALPRGTRTARWLARLVPPLDWLVQVRLVEHDGPLTFVEADGTAYTNVLAPIMLGAVLPLTMPVAYPLTWLRAFVRTRGVAPAGDPIPAPALTARPLALWAACFLAALALTSIPLAPRLAHDTLRFLDLPWYAAGITLLALTGRRACLAVSGG